MNESPWVWCYVVLILEVALCQDPSVFVTQANPEKRWSSFSVFSKTETEWQLYLHVILSLCVSVSFSLSLSFSLCFLWPPDHLLFTGELVDLCSSSWHQWNHSISDQILSLFPTHSKDSCTINLLLLIQFNYLSLLHWDFGSQCLFVHLQLVYVCSHWLIIGNLTITVYQGVVAILQLVMWWCCHIGPFDHTSMIRVCSERVCCSSRWFYCMCKCTCHTHTHIILNHITNYSGNTLLIYTHKVPLFQKTGPRNYGEIHCKIKRSAVRLKPRVIGSVWTVSGGETVINLNRRQIPAALPNIYMSYWAHH